MLTELDYLLKIIHKNLLENSKNSTRKVQYKNIIKYAEALNKDIKLCRSNIGTIISNANLDAEERKYHLLAYFNIFLVRSSGDLKDIKSESAKLKKKLRTEHTND